MPGAVVDLLLSGGFVVTMDRSRRTFCPGSVAIRGRDIVAIGPSSEVDAQWPAATTLRLESHAILPGLVNCHVHAAMSLLRGAAGDQPLPERLRRVVWPYLRAMDEDDCYAASQLGCLEMLKAGITTFADMWPHVGATARAVEESGLRALLSPYLMDRSSHPMDRAGDVEAGSRELEREIDDACRWRSQRVGVALGIQSLSACTEATLQWASAVASERGLPVHIHVAETKAEADAGQSVRELDRLGLLRPRTILAHAVWITPEEMDLIAERGAGVAHNPTSNAKLGVGVAPLRDMVTRGVTVGLGTDSAAANDRHDLFDEMRMALLLQRRWIPAEPLGPLDVLTAATVTGARVVALDHLVGSLEAGKRADLIAVDLRDPRFVPLHPDRPEQVYAHLVFAATAGDVDTVVVDGCLLMREHVVLAMDEPTVIAAAQRAAERLVPPIARQSLARQSEVGLR